MNPLAELVRMIAQGTQPSEIYAFFKIHDLEPIEIDEFLHEVGVQLPSTPKDYESVSPERRQQLLTLSLSDEL